jgi:predicted transposase
MHLSVKIKLHTNQEQYQSLLNSLLYFNKVCNFISNESFKRGKIKNKNILHKSVYKIVREAMPEASSNIVIRAISRVAVSYQISTSKK